MTGAVVAFEAFEDPTDEVFTPVTRIDVASLVFDAERMRALWALAEMMSRSVATVPEHLHGNPSDCLAIVMQATRWGMDPYSVAAKTHFVKGAIGYEAQLVNAVVCTSGAITGRFHYEYRPAESPNDFDCRVAAIPRGETELLWGEWLTCSSITVRLSPLWQTNPRQQMAYLQVKNWARLYAPGAILGVYTPDELAGQVPVRPVGSAVPSGAGLADVIGLTDAEMATWRAEAAKGYEAAVSHWKAMGTAFRRRATKAQRDEVNALAMQANTVETPPAQPAPAPPAPPAPVSLPAPSASASAIGDFLAQLRAAQPMQVSA